MRPRTQVWELDAVDLDSMRLYFKERIKYHRSPQCAGYTPTDAALEVYGREYDLSEFQMTTVGQADPHPDDLCGNCAGWIQRLLRKRLH